LILGARLRLFRVFMGYNQKHLADFLGLTQRQYASLERATGVTGYRERLEHFSLIVGIRKDYLAYGRPPAIETGWLFYDIPPKAWDNWFHSIRGKAYSDLRPIIDNNFREFLIDHSVKQFAIGELPEGLRYYVFPIAPQASCVLRVVVDFWPNFDAITEKLNLELVEHAQMYDVDTPSNLTPGQNLDNIETLLQLHDRLGLTQLTKTWRSLKKLTRDIKTADRIKDENLKRKRLRELCLKIMDLGVDPADVWEELKSIQKDRQH